MDEGYVKTFRSFLKWEWFQKPGMVHLFITLLLLANHKDKRWQGILVKRGQLITSISALKKKTGISTRSLRTIIKHLKSTNELTIKTTSRYTLISIVNWDKYQGEPTNKPTNKLTNDRQTTDNKQECKECKEKNIYTECSSSGGVVRGGEKNHHHNFLKNSSKELAYTGILGHLNAKRSELAKKIRIKELDTFGNNTYNTKFIEERLSEGFKLPDFKEVIDHQAFLAGKSPNPLKYLEKKLLPGLLFSKSLFSGNLKKAKRYFEDVKKKLEKKEADKKMFAKINEAEERELRKRREIPLEQDLDYQLGSKLISKGNDKK